MTLVDRTGPAHRSSPFWVLRELFARQPLLSGLSLSLALAMLPTFVLSVFDNRTLADVNIWVKPLKFMASLSLFALTMAWFVGYVDRGHRTRWPVLVMAVVIAAATSFEIIYITWQASLGGSSHFNVGDSFHAAMYSLMGIGAVSLTATTLALAIVIARYGDRTLAPAFKGIARSRPDDDFRLGHGIRRLHERPGATSQRACRPRPASRSSDGPR